MKMKSFLKAKERTWVLDNNNGLLNQPALQTVLWSSSHGSNKCPYCLSLYGWYTESQVPNTIKCLIYTQ